MPHQIHEAVRSGSLDQVQELLMEDDGMAVLNARDHKDYTPLHVASLHGFLPIVQCLVEHGAEVRAIDMFRRAPIHLASREGHLCTVQYLVENGANLDFRDMLHWTPFYFATKRGHLPIVQYLVQNGVNVNEAPMVFNPSTPLHVASKYGHLVVVQYLVKHGADMNAKNYDGKTPLDLARSRGHVAVANFLETVVKVRLCHSLILHVVPHIARSWTNKKQVQKDDGNYYHVLRYDGTD